MASMVAIALPRDAGTIEIDRSKVPTSIRTKAEDHGYTQKLGDAAAKFRVKKRDEAGKVIEPVNVRDGERWFDTLDEAQAAIREYAPRMLARWYAGEWNLDASARGADPIEAARWTVLFGHLKVAQKDQAARRKAGLTAAYTSLALVRAGKILKGDALKKAVAETQADVDARAEQLVKLILG